MASRVIGRLPVVYYPQTGKLEVESAGEFVETQLFQRLDELAKDKPLRLTLTVEPEHHKRSTAQNSLMWALLTIMADHYNGGRTGGVTPEDCYLEMLLNNLEHLRGGRHYLYNSIYQITRLEAYP